MLNELLTGADFEQRFAALIGETNGAISIAVYQASAAWSQPGIARSAIFDKLIAAAQSGRSCKIVMAQPMPGSPALTFNAQARAELEAAGWLVRFAPAVPPLHAKVYCLAPYWTIIGSHNLSNRAATGNIEASILTNKTNLHAQALALFAAAFEAGS
jgi:phosphatidylserine/phosphatidylglycerophosphate/cardiolipin synthase-like enzyme